MIDDPCTLTNECVMLTAGPEFHAQIHSRSLRTQEIHVTYKLHSYETCEKCKMN